MTLTSYTQRKAFRATFDRFLNFCNCQGPQPELDNLKLDRHSKDCPYKLRIEREKGQPECNMN